MAKMTLVVPKEARGIVTIGTDPSRIRFILASRLSSDSHRRSFGVILVPVISSSKSMMSLACFISSASFSANSWYWCRSIPLSRWG